MEGMPGVGGAVGEAGKQRGISGSTVKIVAVITMLIDHAGAVILARLIIGRERKPIWELFPYEEHRQAGLSDLLLPACRRLPEDKGREAVWTSAGAFCAGFRDSLQSGAHGPCDRVQIPECILYLASGAACSMQLQIL